MFGSDGCARNGPYLLEVGVRDYIEHLDLDVVALVKSV
jgi:hypothetical protein